MAELEELALRRDRRFIVRLILVMTIGVFAGAFVFAGLTRAETQGCAARSFEGVTAPPPSE